MNELSIALGLLAIVAVYLTALAWFALFSDDAMPLLQRVAQGIFAFLIPILGPLTVLHFASPLPGNMGRLVPWPFRSIVAGKPMRKSAGNQEFIDGENHFDR